MVSLGGEPLGDVDTVVLPRSGALSYLTKSGQAVKAARAFSPHLVHVHYAGGFGLWGLRAGVRPMVVSAWGSDAQAAERSTFWRMWLRHLLSRADTITATSVSLQAQCRRLVRADQTVELVPFGVVPCAEQTEYRDEPVRLCVLKSLKPVYGHEVLLNALRLARGQSPHLKLSIAGDGPLRELLQQKVHELGLEDAVAFVGQLPHDQVYKFILDHDLLVMPSLAEGFGVAALEASACGRPVIASRVGGVPEVVRDGETGLLVPPNNIDALADAILKLSSDPTLSRQMGEAGRKLVESEYSWDKSLDLMCDVYDRLIHDR